MTLSSPGFFLKRRNRNPSLPAPGICLWQQSPCHLQSPTRGIFTRCEDVKQSKYPCWTISLEGIGREIRNTQDLESLNKLKFCTQANALPCCLLVDIFLFSLPKKTKRFIIRNMHQPAREENC